MVATLRNIQFNAGVRHVKEKYSRPSDTTELGVEKKNPPFGEPDSNIKSDH